MSAAIRIESVSKSYRQGARILDVVRGVSLRLPPVRLLV